jgi:hypothetical protein
MYFVCTCSETCFTGFRGVLRDANMLVPDAQQDRILPAKRRTSVRRRLVTAARVMVPEMKCELDLYEYVLVQT